MGGITMEQELLNTFDKELLLKDLCARLPYRTKVRRYRYTTPIDSIQSVELLVLGWLEELYGGEAELKPYLFPLSSMTEKQRQELESLMVVITVPAWGKILSPTPEYYDWLNKNHFDYRGLIKKGLAIDATGLNIY